jgi:hypothetical protein
MPALGAHPRARHDRMPALSDDRLQLESTGLIVPRLAFPFWLPTAMVGRSRRLPFPLLVLERTPVIQAYEGLIRHLQDLNTGSTEVALTAVLWRVVALSDRLVDGDTKDRRQQLNLRVARNDSLHDQEKDTWTVLNDAFINYRNAASHMVATRQSDGKVQARFEEAVSYATDNVEELVAASRAIGFAVLQDAAEELARLWPPKDAWATTWRQHEWVGSHEQ